MVDERGRESAKGAAKSKPTAPWMTLSSETQQGMPQKCTVPTQESGGSLIGPAPWTGCSPARAAPLTTARTPRSGFGVRAEDPFGEY
jgi:hypothetical protein